MRTNTTEPSLWCPEKADVACEEDPEEESYLDEAEKEQMEKG